MTIDLFLKRHGEVWEAFKRDPMFIDLIETVRDCDPSRALPLVSATDATENTQHLLGRIAGFNLAINVITQKLVLMQVVEPPKETWTEQPIE